MAKPKVMVALRDLESIKDLVSLACQLSAGMDADLVAMHVVEVPPATPIGAEAEVLDHGGREILASAQQIAKGCSRPLQTLLVRARSAGDAIVGEAKEKGAELLVMGHHKPRPLPVSEILLGSTVNYVVHHAPCRVIVQIPPPNRG